MKGEDVSLDSFVAYGGRYATGDISEKSLVADAFDDVGRADFVANLKDVMPEATGLDESDLFDKTVVTMADLYARCKQRSQDKANRENLFFLRLLHGVDVSIPGKVSGDPIKQLRFQVASQMKNFSYLIGDKKLGHVWAVDPCWDPEGIEEVAARNKVRIVGSVCTHYHFDHVGGDLPDHYLKMMGIPAALYPMVRTLPGLLDITMRPGHEDRVCYVHEAEVESLVQKTHVPRERIRATKDGEKIELGSLRCSVMWTPGHTPGSQCLLLESYRPMRCLTGDTLFLGGSMGRVDGADSSAGDMWTSLNRILSLPEETVLFPAHDYAEMKSNSVANERKLNPAIRYSKQQFEALHGSRY